MNNKHTFPKEGFIKFLMFMFFVFTLGNRAWLNESVLVIAIPTLFILNSMHWFFDFLKYITERGKHEK